MLGAMLFSIFVGFPISFTLIFLAFTFGSWGAGSALTFYLMTLQTNSVMLDDQLVAVPTVHLHGHHDGTGRASWKGFSRPFS